MYFSYTMTRISSHTMHHIAPEWADVWLVAGWEDKQRVGLDNVCLATGHQRSLLIKSSCDLSFIWYEGHILHLYTYHPNSKLYNWLVPHNYRTSLSEGAVPHSGETRSYLNTLVFPRVFPSQAHFPVSVYGKKKNYINA